MIRWVYHHEPLDGKGRDRTYPHVQRMDAGEGLPSYEVRTIAENWCRAFVDPHNWRSGSWCFEFRHPEDADRFTKEFGGSD